MLGFGCFRFGLIVVLFFLRGLLGCCGFGCCFGLGCLLLLWWCVLDGLLDHNWLLDHGLPDWLVGQGFVPSCGRRVGVTPGCIENELEATRDLGSQQEVCQGDALAHKESVCGEVQLEHREDSVDCGLRFVDICLIVGVFADDGSEPPA